jgi:hypothetical protein
MNRTYALRKFVDSRDNILNNKLLLTSQFKNFSNEERSDLDWMIDVLEYQIPEENDIFYLEEAKKLFDRLSAFKKDHE